MRIPTMINVSFGSAMCTQGVFVMKSCGKLEPKPKVEAAASPLHQIVASKPLALTSFHHCKVIVGHLQPKSSTIRALIEIAEDGSGVDQIEH
jgi:hypothetical protein